MSIEFDPAKARTNLRKHGVSLHMPSRRFAIRWHLRLKTRIPLAGPVAAKWIDTMREEYDFSKAKRGAVLQSPGKTRITIMLDDDVIEYFRAQAEAEGVGYQTLINSILRKASVGAGKAKPDAKPLTVSMLRRVLREELHAP